MQYFTLQADSHSEALSKVKTQYGEQARILNHRTVRLGGILGFFTREGIEVSGYLSGEVVKKKPLDMEEEKKKILASVKNDQTLQLLVKEVQSIKERLEYHRVPAPLQTQRHPSVERFAAILQENEFTPTYIDRIVDRLRSTLSIAELDDFDRVQDLAGGWIGESVAIHRLNLTTKPYVFVLVGPTGVGKTTTIAKLAALYGVSSTKPRNVRIITIDNYRIGARAQMETYGEIMEIPVVCAQSSEELRKYLALYQDVDLVFVDTIGKSPRDFVRLGEMRSFLESIRSASSMHLAVSATTKPADIAEVMGQFEPFNYSSVIVTKLDETSRVGNIISVLSERSKPISFFTDGQSVPQDISLASVAELLVRIQGLRIRRDYIEKEFPIDGSVA